MRAGDHRCRPRTSGPRSCPHRSRSRTSWVASWSVRRAEGCRPARTREQLASERESRFVRPQLEPDRTPEVPGDANVADRLAVEWRDLEAAQQFLEHAPARPPGEEAGR